MCSKTSGGNSNTGKKCNGETDVCIWTKEWFIFRLVNITIVLQHININNIFMLITFFVFNIRNIAYMI